MSPDDRMLSCCQYENPGWSAHMHEWHISSATTPEYRQIELRNAELIDILVKASP